MGGPQERGGGWMDDPDISTWGWERVGSRPFELAERRGEGGGRASGKKRWVDGRGFELAGQVQ